MPVAALLFVEPLEEQVHLFMQQSLGVIAYAVLDAADEKNREGSEIAVRGDLAEDLRNVAV